MSGFKKAQRTAVKLKTLVIGPSGGGKTLGALSLASGLAPGKVAVIDSENDRASYYADAIDFDGKQLRRDIGHRAIRPK
jgi:ATP-dependent protease Clp ATPase subunit